MLSFKIGQKVVYPNHGVGLVEKIEDGEIAGVEHTYYHLRLLTNDSKVMVPKENLDLVGLRPLCQKNEIKELFKVLGNGNIDTYKDWKGPSLPDGPCRRVLPRSQTSRRTSRATAGPRRFSRSLVRR